MAITQIKPSNLDSTDSYTFGNVSVANNISATANITGGNLVSSGLISASGNIVGNYLFGNASQLSGLPATYANANVVAYAEAGWSGNIIPSSNAVYSLGSVTNQWKSLYLSNSTLYLANVPLNMGSGNVLQVNGANVLTAGVGDSLSLTGNITSGNVLTGGVVSATGNITGGNLSVADVDATNVYANAGKITSGSVYSSGNVTGGNVLTGGIVSATGNVTGNYIIGNGSQLTGLPAGYANSDVANYLASGSDTQAISTTGNIQGANLLTGGLISASGNITSANLALSYGVISTSGFSYSPAAEALTVGSGPANVIVNGQSGIYAGTGRIISAAGNITGGNILTAGLASTGGNITSGGWVKGANITTGGNVIVDGYISVAGNLYVANIVSTSNLVVEDPLVYFTANATYPYNYDIGFYSQFTGDPGNTYQHTGFVRDYTDNTWKLFSNVVAEPTGGDVNLTNAIYDPIRTGNITAGNVLTAGLVSATGNITGSYLFGNGSQITGLPAGYANSDVAAYLASGSDTQAISTTGNIRGANLLTGGLISATGNATVGNVSATNHTGTTVSITGTVTAASTVGGVITGTSVSVSGNIQTPLNVSSAGNVTGANLVGTGIYGTIQTASQTNITGVGTITTGTWNGTSISTTYTDAKVTSVNGSTGAVTGLATTAGNLSQFASTTSAQLAGVISDETGTGSLVFATSPSLTTPSLGAATGTSVSVTGTVTAASTVGGVITGTSVSASGNITAGNISATNHTGTTVSITGTVTAASTVGGVITGTSLSVSGNVNAGNVIATHYGSGAGLTSIPGANVSGTVANATYATSAGSAATATTATSATTAGTVTTAAQSNITSVGTLTGLTMGGTLLFNNATSPNTYTIQFGDNTGWFLRYMTNVSGTPTQRFSFSDQGVFSAGGNILTSGTISTSGTVVGSVINGASLSLSGTITSGCISGTSISASGTISGSGSGLTSIPGGNVTGTVPNANNSSYLNSISAVNLYNNMGQAHSARTSFDAVTPSYDFGYRYVQGNTNGPGTGGTQYYSWYIGLGSDYPATGSGSYGAMFAVDRNSATPYLSVRYNEGNSFTAWYKIRAGYADSAGTAATVTTAAQPNITSVGTLSSLSVSGTITGGTISATSAIYSTGDIVAYNSSDRRFKTNIRPIANALGTVEHIGGKLFDWTDEYLDKHAGADSYLIQKEDFGVIAQDVQAVFPTAVRTKPDGTLAVDYPKLAALAFAAIGELSERVKKLEEKQ